MALLLALVFLLFGLGGSATESSGPGAGSPSGEPVPAPTPEAGSPQPPRIVLTSAAGTQQAVPGAYCVGGAGTGLCVDTIAPVPKRLSVVRSGEEVVIALPGAGVVKGSAVVRELGCTGDRRASRVGLDAEETSWLVDLEPGAYQLDVFARFEGEDTSGDVSGSLGLLVDGSRPLEVVRAAQSFFVCSEG